MPREDAAQFNGTLSTATYPNRFNVVIPPEGPFYRIGLKLTVADDTAPNGRRTLIEGLDYYLGYYFKELAEAEQDQIYGGFMLLTATEIEYEILGAARQYRVPQSEIGKFLVRTDLEDPRNVDWSELMAYAPVIQPIDPPANLEEAILRDEVVKALEDIRKKIIKRSTELDAAFSEVTNLIYENGKKVFDEELYQHHRNPNAHHYTTDDIAALPVLGRAVDATKAFGLTIDELATLMGSAGIEQSDVDQLMGEALGTVYGRWGSANGNELTFKTAGGHIISIRGDKWLITSPQPLVIKADQDNNESGLAVEFSAGLNTLWVHSGSEQEVLAPVYNSVYLVTPEMVNMYLTSVTLLEANAYFKASDTVKPYGTAKQTNPVTLNANIPTATESVYGLFSITNISTSAALGTAISQKAVTELKDRLDLYVDDDYTVNGKGFVKTGDNMVLTLTKTDFGIDRMDNTTPSAKPVTKALANVLKNKSLNTHTHTTADLDNVPIGSATVDGILQLWDAIDTTNDKAVTSRQGWLFAKEIKKVSDKLNTILPAWTTAGSKYTNNSILPILSMGNYEGYGKNMDALQMVIGVQQGKLYALISSKSALPGTEGIYYAVAGLKNDKSLGEIYKTTFRYKPKGLETNYPGVELKEITVTGTEAFIAKGSDDNYYLVKLNGSMDHSKHTDVRLVTFSEFVSETTWEFVPNMFMDRVVIADNGVYVLRTMLMADLKNNTLVDYIKDTPQPMFRVGLLRLNKTDRFEQVDLRSTRKIGKCADLVEPGAFDVDNPNTKRLAYFTAEGKALWTVNLQLTRGSSRWITPVVKDGHLLTVGVSGVCLGFSSTNGTTFGPWNGAYRLDLLTGEVGLETTNVFPIKIDTTGCYLKDGTKVELKWKWATRSSGYMADNRICVGDMVYSCCCSTEKQLAPSLHYQKLPEGVSYLDYVKLSVGYEGQSTFENRINPVVGSVWKPSMTFPLFFPGTNKVWLKHQKTAYFIEAEYDKNTTYGYPGYGGFGPTSRRVEKTANEYGILTNIPLVVTPEIPNGLLDGAYFIGAESKPCTVVYGTTTVGSDRLSIDAAEWAKLTNIVQSSQFSGASNGNAYERISVAKTKKNNYSLSFWVLGQTMSGGPLCIAIVSLIYKDTDGVNKFAFYFFQVKPTITNGAIRFVSSEARLMAFWEKVASNAINLSPTAFNGQLKQRSGQVFLYSQDGQKFRFSIHNLVAGNLVGSEISFAFGINLTKKGEWFTGEIHRAVGYAYTVNNTSEVYIPDLSGIALVTCNSEDLNELYLGGEQYRISDLFNKKYTVIDKIIIGGVQTQSGWNFYLTEETELSFGNKRYTVPRWSVDLSDEFPTNHANQTFYVYAEVVGSTAQYRIGLEQLADTSSRLFVGTVTTDSNRITDISIDKVKRLGRVKELENHASIVDQHDVAQAFDRKTGPLLTLVNKPVKAPTASASKGEGYVDGQKWASLSGITTRPKLPIQETYSGYSRVSRVAYENCADQFWQKAVAANITLAAASENTQAASANMKWLGAYTKPATGRLVYLTLSLRVQVPGDPGTANRTLKVRLAAPTGITEVYYGINQAGGKMTEKTVNLTVNQYTEIEHTGFKPAEEVRLHVMFRIPKNEYESYRTKFGAVQLIDVESNTVIKQTDIDTPFFVYTDTELTGQSGLVHKAAKGQFHNLPSEPVLVVLDGQTGTNPPVKSTYADGTLTVYVATLYDGVNPLETRIIDKLQFNLMFRS